MSDTTSVTETTVGHTPGPWKTEVPRSPITKLSADDRMILALAFDGSQKAIVDRVRGGTPEQANANALLIAASPDLLASLREFVALYAEARDALGPSVKAKLARAEAAIAKAEGR
jgi:hypothetical protein